MGTTLLPDPLITYWLHVCMCSCLCMSDSSHLQSSPPPFFWESDGSIMILANEMQILLWWNTLWLHRIIASTHAYCARQIPTSRRTSLNSMSDMIRIWPYCVFFTLSRLTVNFSILMSRILSIWPWPVLTRGRCWGRLGEDFTGAGVGVGGWVGGGMAVPLGGSSHLSWSLAGSRLCAAVIQYRNTRICYHWKRSLFPVTSELKFPHQFSKK